MIIAAGGLLEVASESTAALAGGLENNSATTGQENRGHVVTSAGLERGRMLTEFPAVYALKRP